MHTQTRTLSLLDSPETECLWQIVTSEGSKMPKFTNHLHICMHETRKKLYWPVNKCTGCYKLILLTLYSGPAAAVR